MIDRLNQLVKEIETFDVEQIMKVDDRLREKYLPLMVDELKSTNTGMTDEHARLILGTQMSVLGLHLSMEPSKDDDIMGMARSGRSYLGMIKNVLAEWCSETFISRFSGERSAADPTESPKSDNKGEGDSGVQREPH